MTAATRHFVEIDGRTVHFTLTGRGPAALLLHGSPQSSAALKGLGEAFAARGFLAIAPDTPGNGLSDPLPGAPRASHDYARAIDAFLSALKVPDCVVYGFHTGAVHAASFAAFAPSRVRALVLDGLPFWTRDERARLLANYLPLNPPRADGGHLAWLWSRAEAQAIFFPWHDTSACARMPGRTVPPPTATTHAVVLDFLRAGDHYRAPYASAFAAEGEALVSRLGVPTLLCAGQNDPLFSHLERIQSLPSCVERRRMGADRTDAWAEITAWVVCTSGPSAWVEPAFAPHPHRGFLRCDAVAIHWSGGLAQDGQPTLLLHDAGGSVHDFSTDTAGATALAIDLFGHGETGGDAAGDDYLGANRALVEAALVAFDMKRAALIGRGFGAVLAQCFRAHPRVANIEPQPGWASFDDVACLSPRWDGAHLINAWRLAQRRALFSRDAGEGWRDLHALHRQATDLVLSGDAFAFARLSTARD